MIDPIKKIILAVVKKNCNKYGRKSIQSDEHFLDMFLEFVKNYTKWKCLDNHIMSKYTSDNYRKKMIYWTRANVFNDAFDIVSAIMKSKLVNNQSLNCFIDASNIRNINGSHKRNTDKKGDTLLGRIHCDKHKRGLKVTVIVTDKNHLLDINIASGQPHDISVVSETYKKFAYNHKSNKKRRVNLVGDKGYISRVYKKYFAKRKIHYIVPKKKNQKTVDKYTYYDTNLLKKRHLVENYFAHLKQYSRLRFMYEKMVYIYKGFLLLGVMSMMQLT
jgi:aspartate/glutamate racemase